MQSYLVIMTIVLVSCRHVPQHLYWFDNDRPRDYNDNPKWNYCDLKCYQLERVSPGMDFIVISFHDTLKYPFSACYVKNNDKYFLWNKVVTNKFFEKVCGYDYKDWYAEGIRVQSIRGVGIGNEN